MTMFVGQRGLESKSQVEGFANPFQIDKKLEQLRADS